MNLTKTQQKLCNILQDGLPICDRPFNEIAKRIRSNEDEVIKQIKLLKNAGILRRISAIINYTTLGRVSTLVTAQVTEDKLNDVTKAVNALKNVSHNYLRKHQYNMWFTLQGNCEREIEQTLTDLRRRFEIKFNSLPIKRLFKLEIRFDAQGGEKLFADKKVNIPESRILELDEKEKIVISALQDEIKLSAKPFDFLCREEINKHQVLQIIRRLVEKSVIRRIAGVVNHNRLGFVANVLFVCEVPQERIENAGLKLARFKPVSHCCERTTFQAWPYNLFAMLHSRSSEQIQKVIKSFTESETINSFQMLPTVKELKKRPVSFSCR